MTRVLILAAGSGTRWGNYRGTPKYRLLIENEVLIERTYRQFAKYTNDIVIVSNDPEYSFDGPVFYNPPIDENWKEIAKFWSSRQMWGLSKTVMVFADVYFTDEAVDKIMNDKADLSFYLRSQRSEITGKPWREIWGIGFNNNSIPILDKTIMSIIESNEQYHTGGWHLHKKLTINGDRFNTVEIDDWTEDFDFPKDIDIWEKQRKRYGLFTGYIE